jgi:hypothetical protein
MNPDSQFPDPKFPFCFMVFLSIPSVIIFESKTLSRLRLPTALGFKTFESVDKSPSFFIEEMFKHDWILQKHTA